MILSSTTTQQDIEKFFGNLFLDINKSFFDYIRSTEANVIKLSKNKYELIAFDFFKDKTWLYKIYIYRSKPDEIYIDKSLFS